MKPEHKALLEKWIKALTEKVWRDEQGPDLYLALRNDLRTILDEANAIQTLEKKDNMDHVET